jgi:5-formyltetrahydrofolate cyclo-ligase
VTLPTSDPAAKPALRARLLHSRRAVPAQVRADEARALAGWLVELSGTVCAYVPVGSEPGSMAMLDAPVGSEPGSMAMLDALVEAGCTVLLPVVTGPEPLDWAAYHGPSALTPARFGLLEPLGPRLGVSAVRTASTVLVPALAVDRLGVRLGRGGGHYDRTLLLAGRGAELIAVVRDSEVVDSLPREPHDIPMTAVLTPNAGFTPLPH